MASRLGEFINLGETSYTLAPVACIEVFFLQISAALFVEARAAYSVNV